MNDTSDIPARRRPAAGAVDVEALAARFRDRKARIGVIGLGYVGLPLARAAAERGFQALGVDIDRAKVDLLNAGGSYISHISARQHRRGCARPGGSKRPTISRGFASATRSSCACRRR